VHCGLLIYCQRCNCFALVMTCMLNVPHEIQSCGAQRPSRWQSKSASPGFLSRAYTLSVRPWGLSCTIEESIAWGEKYIERKSIRKRFFVKRKWPYYIMNFLEYYLERQTTSGKIPETSTLAEVFIHWRRANRRTKLNNLKEKFWAITRQWKNAGVKWGSHQYVTEGENKKLTAGGNDIK
jgi:hypothetical protein